MAEQSRKEQLEQRLALSSTPLSELLNHELAVQLFRGNDPAVHSYLTLNHFRELVKYVSVVGPEHQMLRSYQYPQVACDLLTSEHHRVFQALFLDCQHDFPNSLIGQLLSYFEGQPNYVLSSYICRILTLQYHNQPVRTQQVLFEHDYPKKMLKFLSSRSVAELLAKLICVEDELLLLLYFQQRRELLLEVIAMYERNSEEEEVLSQTSFLLGELVAKLWSSKYKESGKFSSELFKIVETVLEKTGLYDQEALIGVVTKNISLHSDEAPFLIKSLARRIFKQLSQSKTEYVNTTFKQNIPKFTIKKLRLLHALTSIFAGNLSIIEPLLTSLDFFGMLLNLMQKHQWNNIVHVQVEKIFKFSFNSNSKQVFNAIFEKGDLANTVLSMIKKQRSGCGKFGRGYTGCLTNILLSLKQHLQKPSELGQFLHQSNPDFSKSLLQYLQPKLAQHRVDLAGFKVNLGFATPKYQQTTLLDTYKIFLEAKNMQQTPTKSQIREVLEEIEKESEVNQQLVKEELEAAATGTGTATVSFTAETTSE